MENNNRQLSEEMLTAIAQKYIEKQAKRLEDETLKLNQEEANRPTEKQLRKFRRICRKEFRKKNRKVAPFYKAAVAVAAFFIVFNISVMSVPALRSVALNFLTGVRTAYTEIKISDEDMADRKYDLEMNPNNIELEHEYVVTYIPRGYTLMEKKYTRETIGFYYFDEEEHYIMYSQYKDKNIINKDTEDAMVRQIDINGDQALMTKKDDYREIAWRVDDYFISIVVDGLTEEELIKVAESVEMIR